MMAAGLGLSWAVIVALVLGERRTPARLPWPPRRAPVTGPRPLWAAAVAPPRPPKGDSGHALGACLRRRTGRPRSRRRPPGRLGHLRRGRTGALGPASGPDSGGVVGARAHVDRRRARRAHEAAIADQLPDVVDLLALTTAAGLPITAALCAIGRRPGGPLGAALARAAAHIERGGTTAAALEPRRRRHGASTRPLVDALAAHDRYGTPLAPALERVAIESRLRRRRQAEEAARRLPVTLLFPLVLTTLPAFALLTVVPLLAGSFGSLSL